MGLIQSVEGPEGETSGSLGKDRCLGLLCRPGRVSRCPAGPRPAPDLGPVRPVLQPSSSPCACLCVCPCLLLVFFPRGALTDTRHLRGLGTQPRSG